MVLFKIDRTSLVYSDELTERTDQSSTIQQRLNLCTVDLVIQSWNLRFYPIIPRSRSYIRNIPFSGWSRGFVSCTKLFGNKCMHQYTKRVYAKSKANFGILNAEIETHTRFFHIRKSVKLLVQDFLKSSSEF